MRSLLYLVLFSLMISVSYSSLGKLRHLVGKKLGCWKDFYTLAKYKPEKFEEVRKLSEELLVDSPLKTQEKLEILEKFERGLDVWSTIASAPQISSITNNYHYLEALGDGFIEKLTSLVDEMYSKNLMAIETHQHKAELLDRALMSFHQISQARWNLVLYKEQSRILDKVNFLSSYDNLSQREVNFNGLRGEVRANQNYTEANFQTYKSELRERIDEVKVLSFRQDDDFIWAQEYLEDIGSFLFFALKNYPGELLSEIPEVIKMLHLTMGKLLALEGGHLPLEQTLLHFDELLIKMLHLELGSTADEFLKKETLSIEAGLLEAISKYALRKYKIFETTGHEIDKLESIIRRNSAEGMNPLTEKSAKRLREMKSFLNSDRESFQKRGQELFYMLELTHDSEIVQAVDDFEFSERVKKYQQENEQKQKTQEESGEK